MGGVLFKMVAVLLCFRLGLAAAVGKGRMVQQASVVRIAEDLSDDDEGRLRNTVLLRRFRKGLNGAGIDFFIGPGRLIDDGCRRVAVITAADEFFLQAF